MFKLLFQELQVWLTLPPGAQLETSEPLRSRERQTPTALGQLTAQGENAEVF